MVSPQSIKYNNWDINEFLTPLTVILDVSFESDNGVTSSYLNRSAVASESYDGHYKNTYRYKYDELFSPQFTIVKNDFSDFSQSEVRQVLKYFTQTDRPSLLEVSYDKDGEQIVEEDRNFCAIGGWISIETYKISNSRTVGIVARFEAITPYAMSHIYRRPAVDNKITIDIKTDDNKPVYPRITIKQTGSVVRIPDSVSFSNIIDMVDCVEDTAYYNGTTWYWKTTDPEWRYSTSKPNYKDWEVVNVTRAYTKDDEYADNTFYHYIDGNMYYWIDPYSFHSSIINPNLQTTSVKIKNQHYDFFNQPTALQTMIVKHNTSDEKVVVDGANKVISSSSVRRIFGDDFQDWAWLPLYDGKNEITIEGNCEVTFEYREIRKIGEW